MALTTFDTLKFVRRLEQAGVSVEQAEIQAEVLTEAFNVNLDSLVTKEHLEVRFAEQTALFEKRFADMKAYIDTSFAKQDARIDSGFARVDARFNFITWILAVLTAGVFIPLLERLLILL
ncbi:MAG: DUF1640 domain-containing protein [Pseudomonadales bacterium]